jgi:surface antigen
MIRKSVLMLLTSSLLLAACQSDSNPPPNAAVNPIAKQAIRGNTPSPVSGVLIGGFPANIITNDTDRTMEADAERRAFVAPVGQQVTWSNEEDSNSGSIKPIRDGYASTGAYCREFEQKINVNAQQQKGFSKACQQADGNWQIVQ